MQLLTTLKPLYHHLILINMECRHIKIHRLIKLIIFLLLLLMKKETVIEDAVTYIQQLKGHVLFLCDQALQVEPLEEEETKPKPGKNAAEEMKNCGIEVVAASPHLIIMNCSCTSPYSLI